ncbi:MAG TPA: STAS domain-containing protein [Verrucomicrobiae bacterium]|jgi:anti-sigma B factor antagonist|nr:STAS domain-containing protein [Verrucomicrobiae bacterium]
METVIGVFHSRGHAENAVRELLEKKIPQESIVFLSRSEGEAKTIGKQFGATVGGFAGGAVGMSTGVVAATLLIPGLGPVFALGFGAAALLGLSGAGAGSVLGKKLAGEGVQTTAEAECSQDVTFFQDVLSAGRSLIVVRSESPESARTAGEVLDRLGIGIQGSVPVAMQTAVRHVDDVAIVTVTGRITSGQCIEEFRQTVKNLLDKNTEKILIDLHGVGYLDSAGLGELVRTYSSVRNGGGQAKVLNPSKRVHDLLQMTRLASVFDVQPDEATALQSFTRREPQAVA